MKIVATGPRGCTHAMPTISQYREFASAGGLMSYGGSDADMYRRMGAYAGRILNGEKPADLPVQQATRIELVLQPGADHVRMEIRDNGQGFDPAAAMNRGLGLPWMEYKARRAGVSLTVESRSGQGTLVQAIYQPANERDEGDGEHGEVKRYAIRDPIG